MIEVGFVDFGEGDKGVGGFFGRGEDCLVVVVLVDY